MASKRNRAVAWAGRACLLAALMTAASGGGAVSAEPPAPRGPQEPAGASARIVPDTLPSRTLGILAQDSWLGE